MNKSLQINSLQKLSNEDYDQAVLSVIQTQAFAQVIESQLLMGNPAPKGESLVHLAQEALPKGDHLYKLYMHTYMNLAKQPIEDLESAAKDLSSSINSLERVAVSHMSKNMTLSNYARIEQSVGDRYAQIIIAANNLESIGVIPSQMNNRLLKISDRPSGPLEAFYDKAMAIVIDQYEKYTPEKMRMAA